MQHHPSERRYLFEFTELFSVLGEGTPENPGGDFSMYCWIVAPDPQAALEWGYVLLGDYFRARFSRSEDADLYDGSPVREGAIVDDPELLARAGDWAIPSCRVGQIPEWREPWRISNAA
jgi:hypothetical protein